MNPRRTKAEREKAKETFACVLEWRAAYGTFLMVMDAPPPSKADADALEAVRKILRVRDPRRQK
jgi:hypothetical protein